MDADWKKVFLIGLFLINIFLFLLFSITQRFPFYAVLINIVSIVLLLSWIIDIKLSAIFFKKHFVDLLSIVCLFFIALIVYLYKVDIITPGIHGDELTVARAGEHMLSLLEYAPFIDINYGHPTPLLYLTGLSIKWFGGTFLAIRLPSIIFGALSVACFYVLLRLFFNKTVSITTSLLTAFSYPLVVVSRLAYETTPSLFFQILTAIFLYCAWKTKDIRYYAALGLSLGAGLYTYIGFRTFAFLVLIISTFIAFKTSEKLRDNTQKFSILILGLFIITAPLLSYGLIHTEKVMERAKSLSVFHQGLPASEVIKELQGNTFRLTNLFLPTGNLNGRPNGDPDPRRNPSSVALFDLGTFLLFIIGITYLFKKNKHFLLILIILSTSPLINDIFSLERIPEGHYYGIGHPNTLRIAAIIPIIYFAIACGLNGVKPIFEGLGKGIYSTAVILIVFFLIMVNWSLYFNQPFSEYNYKFNGAITIHVVDFVNKSQAKEFYISSDFADDDRFRYFIKKDKVIKTFKPRNYDYILSVIRSNEITILNPIPNKELAEKLVTSAWNDYQSSLNVKLLNSPVGTVDAVIFTKVN